MRPLNKRVPRVLLVATVAAALAGCGSSGPIDEVKSTVSEVFTSQDVSVCTDLVTTRFIASVYGKNRAQALTRCEASQEKGNGTADSVAFRGVTIDGKRATATFVVRGGPLDRRTVAAGLIDQDGWKIDALRASPPPPTPREQRALVDAALKEGLASREHLTDKQASCVVNYLSGHASNAQLAADLEMLRKHQLPPDFAAAIRGCVKPKSAVSAP
jgi:hypothetical protein